MKEITLDDLKEKWHKFEACELFPDQDQFHYYDAGHVFDEEMSVKWNREEVERRNANYEAEKQRLRNLRQEVKDEFLEDVVQYIQSVLNINRNQAAVLAGFWLSNGLSNNMDWFFYTIDPSITGNRIDTVSKFLAGSESAQLSLTDIEKLINYSAKDLCKYLIKLHLLVHLEDSEEWWAYSYELIEYMYRLVRSNTYVDYDTLKNCITVQPTFIRKFTNYTIVEYYAHLDPVMVDLHALVSIIENYLQWLADKMSNNDFITNDRAYAKLQQLGLIK